jgi:PTH1 family peptidyl-tRNA hydrolase
MKLIVGLGNIGEKYVKTRHNVGFMFLDYLVSENNSGSASLVEFKEQKKLKALVTKIRFKGEEFLLAKPTTFMNLSGQALTLLTQYYKIDAEDVFIVYDDVDLELEKVRFREKGSAGTHNGMKSILKAISGQEIKRIRIGIESRGRFAPAKQDLHSFVLERFRDEELDLLPEVFKKAEDFLDQKAKLA